MREVSDINADDDSKTSSALVDLEDLPGQESVALWRAILRTAADPIIIIDGAGTILKVNEATRTLFGYSADQLLGENVSMLMPEPYRSAHDGYLAAYLETGHSKIIGVGREVEAMKSDGTVFPMALAVSEVATDTRPLFTGIIHDLTARHEAERKLREANETLEERVTDRTQQLQTSLVELNRSNRDLEQFAYVASHDLQAPLRNVKQGLELLDEHLTETVGAGFDDEADELRTHVVDAVVRMENLIQGMLSYARVNRSETATVNLNDVLGHVLQQLAVDIEGAEVTVTASDLPVVNGNETQLRQLLQNLLQNAIQYRSAARPLEIAVDAHPNSDGWQLTVRDNGTGVDDSQHSRIFELFRRGSSRSKGVGLGLAICQRIVESHGGTIWVESKPEHGAAFHFTLPAHDDAGRESHT